MKIRPTDDRVRLPMTKTFTPQEVVWTYRAPTKTWEITLGWVTLELNEAEAEAFIKSWVAHLAKCPHLGQVGVHLAFLRHLAKMMISLRSQKGIGIHE